MPTELLQPPLARPGSPRGADTQEAPAVAGGAERRRYPRLQAPVLCRPAPFFEWRPRRVVDVSLSGARVYSDAERRPRERLELELWPPTGGPIVVRARVAWVRLLPPGAPAVYDVGFEFTDVSHADADRLRAVLDDSTAS